MGCNQGRQNRAAQFFDLAAAAAVALGLMAAPVVRVPAHPLLAQAVLVALAEQQYLLARPVALAADAVRQE